MQGLTCSGVCQQGGDGVPRRTGEALSARFRIPPCFWVRLLQEARFPLGPKAHCSGCRLTLPSYYTSPHLVSRCGAENRRRKNESTVRKIEGGRHGQGPGAVSDFNTQVTGQIDIFFLLSLHLWIWP